MRVRKKEAAKKRKERKGMGRKGFLFENINVERSLSLFYSDGKRRRRRRKEAYIHKRRG